MFNIFNPKSARTPTNTQDEIDEGEGKSTEQSKHKKKSANPTTTPEEEEEKKTIITGTGKRKTKPALKRLKFLAQYRALLLDYCLAYSPLKSWW